MFPLALSLPPQISEPPTPSVTFARTAPPHPHSPALELDVAAVRDELINSVTSGLWPDMPGQHLAEAYQPRTALGVRLLALRNSYVRGGGELLSVEALDDELRARRGGVSDD